MITELSTDRLRLTPLTAADKSWIEMLYVDQAVTLGFGRNAFSSSEVEKKAKQLLGAWTEDGFSQFLVIDKASTEVTGLGGIRPTKTVKVGEIGYVFMPKWWGKGLASEAVRAWVNWGLDDLKLDAIIANGVENPASKRVLEKAGFEVTNLDGHFSTFKLSANH